MGLAGVKLAGRAGGAARGAGGKVPVLMNVHGSREHPRATPQPRGKQQGLAADLRPGVRFVFDKPQSPRRDLGGKYTQDFEVFG
jgi:hypothetical protein